MTLATVVSMARLRSRARMSVTVPEICTGRPGVLSDRPIDIVTDQAAADQRMVVLRVMQPAAVAARTLGVLVDLAQQGRRAYEHDQGSECLLHGNPLNYDT